MPEFLDPSALESLFNDVVSAVSDGLSEGLDAFQNLTDSAAAQDFQVINDAALVLVGQVADAADIDTSFLADVFNSWAEALGNVPEAFAHMVSRLSSQFSHLAEFFRALMLALVATIDDFEAFLLALTQHVIDTPEAIMRGVQTVLLPVFAIGAASFGSDSAVGALWLLLGQTGGVLGQTATPFDVGFDLDGVSALALTSGAFTLPLGVWVVALMLDALRQAGAFADLLADTPIGNGQLNAALEPIVGAIGDFVTDYIADAETLLETIIATLIEQGEADPELEWLLLKLGRFTPVGLFMLAVATSIKLVTSPAPWIDLVLNEVERDPRYKTKRLDRPDKAHKYIVLSDIHRDEDGASKGPFRLGSIDHFLNNADDYLALLQHLDSGVDADGKPLNYTIIEAGDCEEMWFHGDVSQLSSATPPAMLRRIIESHEEIYKLLRKLHHDGRYYRIYGNHDSYLRNAETQTVLREFMEADGDQEFQIYDFVIVEGVKTMHDLRVDLGLNSAPYSERLPLLITHGHQWDFWNCDSNNILGKLVVTSVVTPLDQLDDPVRDVAGIGFAGTPLINFKQLVGDLPVLNSWQNYEPAVAMLDHVQHMDDTDRVFTDDIMYSETLASLMGLLIPVDPGAVPAPSGLIPLPGDATLPPWSSLCIGHTHNPHNMPYYDLDALPLPKSIREKMDAAAEFVLGPLADLGPPKFRSYYMNTGVCGWYDNCFWAVDLGKEGGFEGQPKLVNWTWNTRLDRPNHMDWELPHIAGQALPGLSFGDVKTAIEPWIEEGVRVAGDLLGRLSIGDILAEAQRDWVPHDLKIALGAGKGALDALLVQFVIGLMRGGEATFEASFRLPKALTREIGHLLKRRLPCANRSRRRSLCGAIGILAVRHGVAQSGLRGAAGDPAQAQAIGALMLLAQLVEVKRDGLDIDMSLRGGVVTARFTFDKAAQQPAKPALPKQPARLVETGLARRAQPSRGLQIEACANGDPNAPLADWSVALETRVGGRKKVLARARFDDKGRATLLGLAAKDDLLTLGNRRVEKARLALFAPPAAKRAKKPVASFALDKLPKRGPLKLSVSFAQLEAAGFFGGSKVRSVAEKQKALCDRWKERLKRDPHAKDDLCLQDLVFSIMGALDDPKTPFEKQYAKMLKPHLKDTKQRKTVADFARKQRKTLKDCLGSDYVTCDGTGSLDDLGKRLIGDDIRLEGLVKFFGNPTPNPLLGDKIIQPGRGLPGRRYQPGKDCEDRLLNGSLADEVADQIRALLDADAAALAKPSINQTVIWDPEIGQVTRRGDIHDKELSFYVPSVPTPGAAPEPLEHTQDMGVFLSDPNCVVMLSDAVGEETPTVDAPQIMVVDVVPGQAVTLFGSGLVDDKAKVRAQFRPWRTELNDGRLVPDDDALPADGFASLEVPVWGNGLPITAGVDPTDYHGDSVGFIWPDAANAPGLYAVTLEMANTSEFPSSFVESADCGVQIGKEDVQTQVVYFAVLPKPSAPPLHLNLADVVCDEITDPEGFLDIIWPDDLRLESTTAVGRFIIPDGGVGDAFKDDIPAFTDAATHLMDQPSTWAAEMRLFPEELGVGQLEALDFVIAEFRLFEVDGEYDRTVARWIYLAILLALIAIALIIAAAAFVAVAVLFPKGIVVAGQIILLVLKALFGVGIPLYLTAMEASIAAIDGAELIMPGKVAFAGQDLMIAHSEVRFHRLAHPDVAGAAGLLPREEVFESDALGGDYTVTVEILNEA